MKSETVTPAYDPWNPVTWPTEHVFWWTFFFLNMVFVWFTPLDVLDRYPQLVPFTDFMASWNTQIRRLGEFSGPANQANRFCSSVFWCLMPLVMLRVLAEGVGDRKKGGVVEMSSFQVFKVLFATLVGMYMFWIIPNHPVESSRIGRALFVSPIGRGFFLPGMAYIFGIMVFTCLAMVLTMLRGKLIAKGNR